MAGHFPLVSIIIPCYNYGHFLPETLENIRTMSYQNWECILVDDGSEDETAKISREIVLSDTRFRYVYQENSGLSAARNKGYQESIGEFLQFLDADDRIHSEKIEKQVAFMKDKIGVDILYGNATYFHIDSEVVVNSDKVDPLYLSRRVSGSGVRLIKAFCINNFMAVSSPLLRRSVVEKVGLFDTSYRAYEDWQFWFRCAVKNVCFQFFPEPGTETFIRYGHVSMMTDKNRLTVYGIKIRKYMMPFLPFHLKLYNCYRLMKLFIKKLLFSEKHIR